MYSSRNRHIDIICQNLSMILKLTSIKFQVKQQVMTTRSHISPLKSKCKEVYSPVTSVEMIIWQFVVNRYMHLSNAIAVIQWITSCHRSFMTTFYDILLYDVVIIQWITSCHKNRKTVRVITFWRVHGTSLTTTSLAKRFLIEIMLIWKR